MVDTHLLIVVEHLPTGARLQNASGATSAGAPYIRVFLDGGVLDPGETLFAELRFSGRPAEGYLLSGQGTP